MLLDTIKILVQSAQNEQDYLHCKKLLEDKLVWLQCEQHKIFSNTKMLDILPDNPVEDAIGITLLSLITQSPEFQELFGKALTMYENAHDEWWTTF